MAETAQQDEAKSCLANAAYCEFAATRTDDKELKKYYTHLSAEWQKEAQNKAPTTRVARAEVPRASKPAPSPANRAD
jgi:hypothetical protein